MTRSLTTQAVSFALSALVTVGRNRARRAGAAARRCHADQGLRVPTRRYRGAATRPGACTAGACPLLVAGAAA